MFKFHFSDMQTHSIIGIPTLSNSLQLQGCSYELQAQSLWDGTSILFSELRGLSSLS